KHEALDVAIGTVRNRMLTGTLGGAPLTAVLKRDPPDPGASNPRVPPAIDGIYAISPRSICFGGSIVLKGGGTNYSISAKLLNLGRLTYSKTSGLVFGDIACTRG